MKALRETTVWTEKDYRVPNHIYLLDGDKMVAYVPEGGVDPFYFKNPIKFSRTGRKFEEVTPSPFNQWDKLLKAHIDVAEPLPFIKKVQGSKPNTWYEVNTNEKTCTCQGFTFRGTCKHVKELENK
jgi:hypothetical protein